MKKLFFVPLLSLAALIGTSCGGHPEPTQLTLHGIWGSFSEGSMVSTLKLNVEKGTKLKDVKGYIKPTPYYDEVHTFKGWALDMYGENKIDEEYVIDGKTTIYAQWDVKEHPDTTYLLFDLHKDHPEYEYDEVEFHYTFGDMTSTNESDYPEITVKGLVEQKIETPTTGYKIDNDLIPGENPPESSYKTTKITFGNEVKADFYVITIKNNGNDNGLNNFRIASREITNYEDMSHVFTYGNNLIYGVALADSNTIIPEYAYATCNWLMAIELPKIVKEIPTRAFYMCMSLDFLDVPEDTTSIGIDAFYGCLALHHIYFNKKLTTIKESAFGGCISLEAVHLPDSLTTMEREAFRFCISNTEVTLGKGLTELNPKIFGENERLESIFIPNTVKIVNGAAFQYCSSLEEVVFEDGDSDIKTDEKQVFQYCISLTNFTASNRFKRLGERMFNHTMLSEIDLTACNWVVEMGTEALGSDTPLANGYGKIVVPGNLVEEYKQKDGWKEYSNLIVGA